MTRLREYGPTVGGARRPLRQAVRSRSAQPRGKHGRRQPRSILRAGCAALLRIALGIVAARAIKADPDAVAVSDGAEDHPTTTPTPTPTTGAQAPPQPTSPSTPSTSPPQPTTTTTGVDIPRVAVPPGVPEQFTYFE